MAEWSGPFEDTTDFNEEHWRRLLSQLNPDGINGHYGSDDLQVTVSMDGQSVNVAPGYAHVQGALYHNDASLNLEVSPNGGGSVRHDRCVLRYDPTENEVAAAVAEGTPGGSVTPPDLEQEDNNVWEIPLARWVRNPGGGIVTLRDERQFVDRSGMVMIPDEANEGENWIHTMMPAVKPGRYVLLLPSGRQYMRNAYGHWDRTDAMPIVEATSATSITLSGGGTWTSGTTAQRLQADFYAPSSGAVRVTCMSNIRVSTAYAHMQVRILGPGGYDNLGDPNNNNIRALQVYGASTLNRAGYSWSYVERNLVPAQRYTARLVHQSTGQANFDQRRLWVDRT